ncbi:diguanylate cyclase [Cohnella algarum]|uniref:sensor domain-containing diguanylate cyclase n=1 Tax=Cohnella algarum TaxID=2044859 RepID=UPI001967BBE1|nr:diguanylate cyclase [Cohnella algarum]MBN2982331.1 diguanylate cyclase [Cohnella algarum]
MGWLRGMVPHTVSRKLFLTFFIAMSVLVSVFGAVSYRIAESKIVNKVKENALQAAEQTIKRFDLRFAAYEQMNFRPTDDQEMQLDLVVSSRRSAEALPYDSLQASTRLKNALYAMRMTDPFILSYTLYPYDLKTTDDWYEAIVEGNGANVWLETKERGFISPQYVNVFGVGRVLKDNEKNKPLRILIMELDGRLIEDEMKALQTSDRNTLYMINTDGQIVHLAGESNYGIGRRLPWWEMAPLPANEKATAVQMKVGRESFLIVTCISPKTGWILVNQIPLKQLSREAADIWVMTAVMIVISVILSVLIGMTIARRVGKPLAELSRLMQRGEQGDMNVRAEMRSRDEIGQVANSFNKMIGQLREALLLTARTAHLEAQVEMEAIQRKHAETLSQSVIILNKITRIEDIVRMSLSGIGTMAGCISAGVFAYEHGTQLLQETIGTVSDGSYDRWKDMQKNEQRWAVEEVPSGERCYSVAAGSLHVGVLFRFTCGPNDLPNESVLEALFTYASQAAATIENVRRYEEMERLATTDGLTGIWNRRHLMKLTELAFEQARINHSPVSILLFDIDRFKRINDEYGHSAGDEVLKHVSRIVSKRLRPGSIFGRYGGEEFMIVMPGSILDLAGVTAEALRKAVESSTVQLEDTELRFTASFGAAESDPGEPFAAVVNRADSALYQAKSEGRNRVIVHPNRPSIGGDRHEH